MSKGLASWPANADPGLLLTMSTEVAEQAVLTTKKLRPARKQVAPGDIERTETPQTGKEYSKLLFDFAPL